ncbi:MAG: hypothetical protein HKN27_01005 [Silicimonas sp.]|nr:hypothetical protein [Silicimonas sp.]
MIYQVIVLEVCGVTVMRNLVAAASVFFACSFAAQAMEGPGMEEDFWAIASQSESAETLNAFLEAFPDGKHAEEARAMVDEFAEDDRRREFEESIFAMVGQVTYDAPLSFGNEAIIGRSLSNITELSPIYPPVEGLPESYWKNEDCGSCHQWTRADLCTQASTYIEKKPVTYQSKQHPFGGLLKINMRNWAIGGCQ